MSAPPGQITQLRAAALASLDGIERELMISHLNRQIYAEFRDEFVARHPDADATFLNSYAGLYARGQVMVIRRLADQHRDKPEGLPRVEVTSELACPGGRPERMTPCPSPIRKSSATTS